MRRAKVRRSVLSDKKDGDDGGKKSKHGRRVNTRLNGIFLTLSTFPHGEKKEKKRAMRRVLKLWPLGGEEERKMRGKESKKKSSKREIT